jgi:hypothetical protein
MNIMVTNYGTLVAFFNSTNTSFDILTNYGIVLVKTFENRLFVIVSLTTYILYKSLFVTLFVFFTLNALNLENGNSDRYISFFVCEFQGVR